MKRFINPVPQFMKNNGDLSSYGKLYFLQEGSDNLSDTISIYSSPDGDTELTNPVTLTGEGRITSVFGEGRCRVKYYDAAGVLQWSRDYDFTADSSQFDLWNSQKTYIINEIARGSDGFYYRSQTNGNKGNDPTNPSSSGDWSKIAIIEYFNADKVGGYANDEIVILNGRLYASNTAGNTTTPPDASWDDLSFNNTVTGNLTVTGTIITDGFVKQLIARKTTGQTVTSSTTLVDVSGMSLALENGIYYHIRAHIRWNAGATTANGIKVSFVGASHSSWMWIGNTNASTANAAPTANSSGGTLTFTKMPNAPAAADECILFDAIVVGAVTPYKMQFAQAVSDATATTLMAQTTMIATRLG